METLSFADQAVESWDSHFRARRDRRNRGRSRMVVSAFWSDERHVFGAEWQISRMQGPVSVVLRVPLMIASGLWTNNGNHEVIHRFHKRESCVFHSIHRFDGIFRGVWNRALTCGDVGMERLFDDGLLE